MEIKIRNIKKQDIESLVQMCSDIGYEVRYEILSARLNDVAKYRNSSILVAADSRNNPVGWIQLELSNFIFSEKSCNILGLYVEKKYRGLKVGRMLMEKAVEWAEENKCSGLQIFSDITRIDSHDFYLHQNFKLNKTQQTYYKSLKYKN